MRLSQFFASTIPLSILAFGCAPDGNDPSADPVNLPNRGDGGKQEAKAQENGAGAGASAKRRQAVAFIHGTSDHGDLSKLVCKGTGDDWHCVSNTAVADYWTQPNIDSERTRPDGSRYAYVVIGCPLAAQTPWPNPTPVKPKGGPAEPGSAACVAAEIAKFLDGPDGKTGTEDDVQDLALITHSGGSNVVRYILQQHSARPEFGRVHAASRGFIALAAPSMGTYLADRVFRFGLLSIGDRLFNSGYDDDGVEFIQTANMTLFNRDPAKLVDLSKDVAGVPAYMASGSYPDKDGEDAKIACGGASETKGLNVLHHRYLDETEDETARDGCSDGFISCKSAMALTGGDESRVIFGTIGQKTIGKTRFRAHNQSRRACDGLDVDVRNKVNEILAGGGASKTFISGDLAAVTPFSPLMKATLVRHRGIALEASSITSAHRGETARVRVETVNDAAALRGFLEGPAGDRLVVTFEQSDGKLYAVGQLPTNAPAGSWTVHVGASADAEPDDARIPLWVSGSEARIVTARASRESGGVAIRIGARGKPGARLGVRATLVTETGATGEESWTIGSGQASANVGGDGRVEIPVRLSYGGRIPDGKIVVRDVVLVSHDDASTLEVRDRVDLSP